MTYFINRTFGKSGPLGKADSGPTKNVDPVPKFTVYGQKHLYDKLEVVDFDHDNNFLNLKIKITQTRHFWFQV